MTRHNRFRLRRIAVGAVAAYQELTTLKSNTSGEHWITPTGIPGPIGAVNTTRRTKLVARYPNNAGGTLYPIQTEQFKSRELSGGSMIHCTGHVKLPAGYVAGEKVGIGYSDTHSFPAAPNWATLTAGGDNHRIELSVYEPRLHWVSFTQPSLGDLLTVAITDNIGTQTYSWRMNGNDSTDYIWTAYSLSQLIKSITQDPNGRYRCFDGCTVPPNEVGDYRQQRPMSDVQNHFGNSAIPNSMGARFGGIMSIATGGAGGGGGLYSPAPRVSLTNPSSLGRDRWPDNNGQNVSGFYIWPRYAAGNPENYTVDVTVTRAHQQPYDTETTAFQATHYLDYTGATGNFTIYPNLRIWFRDGIGTFLGNAEVVGQVDNGTTGRLYLRKCYGTFPPGATFTEAYDTAATYGSVTATMDANGLRRVVLTGASSGATADIEWIANGVLSLSNRSGPFTDNEVITSTDGGSALINGAATQSACEVVLNCTTATVGITATSGTVTPINDASPRVTYYATFDAATATPDSPWFNGHQVHQIERKMAFKRVSDDVAHPHLEAWFRTSWSRDGTVIDRQVTVENPKMFANVRDYWYDAEVFVGGVSQTAGQAKYRLLYHAMWERWTWYAAKPFGMCDAADFMRARLVDSWYRRPTEDRTVMMSPKLRGSYYADGDGHPWHSIRTNGEWNYEKSLKPDGGYVRPTLNEPLYRGSWLFDTLGGYKPELGLYNAVTWMFWTGDTIASWPSMLAMADNVAGAFGFACRDEHQTGEFENAPPHFYLKWGVSSEQSKDVETDVYGTKTGGLGGGPDISFGRPMAYNDNETRQKVVTQKYNLKPHFLPPNTHTPEIGTYSAYIVCPEKRLYDAQEQFAWYYQTNQGNGRGQNIPKAGGTPGDVNHVLAYSIGSNRAYAWCMREVLAAAFMKFEGARRRTMWKRAAQDSVNHYNVITPKRMWGKYEGPYNYANKAVGTAIGYKGISDDWDQIYDESVPNALNTYWKEANDAWGANSPGQTVSGDTFKSHYVSWVIKRSRDLEVADANVGIQAQTWNLKCLDNTPDPPNNWTWFLGGGGVTYLGTMWQFQDMITIAGDALAVAAPDHTCRFWNDTDGSMADLMALMASFSDTRKRNMIHSPTVADVPMQGTYNMPRYHAIALHTLAYYHADSAIRTRAQYYIDLIYSTWPMSQTVTMSDGTVRTADKSVMQLGLVPESAIVSW
jgi:hypothetical protein